MGKRRDIREMIQELIDGRREALQKEILDFDNKRRDAESYYGLGGGFAPRYEKCIELREEELLALSNLEKGYGSPAPCTKKITRYVYRCSCGSFVELRERAPREYIDCPFCRGGISRATESKTERTIEIPPVPNWWDEGGKAWRDQFV